MSEQRKIKIAFKCATILMATQFLYGCGVVTGVAELGIEIVKVPFKVVNAIIPDGDDDDDGGDKEAKKETSHNSDENDD